MSMIECYEPDFVRAFLSHHPDSLLKTQMVFENEIRQSLTLTTAASCKAALGAADAFSLHVTQCDAIPNASPLSARQQTLNQAALDVITLPELSEELRLYALGIMVSYSDKLTDESPETLSQLATIPQGLAAHAEAGRLQQQFACLPTITQLQCQLLTRLGGLALDWDSLPESPRRQTLQLQVSLLMLQDANSEALLQQQLATQWQTTRERYFAPSPWVLNNYLIYRLYHDTFPQQAGADTAECYFTLVTDYFLLRTLFSLWTLEGSSLNQEEIFAIFALFERWRYSEDAALTRLQIRQALPADPLLCAFSLLTL